MTRRRERTDGRTGRSIARARRTLRRHAAAALAAVAVGAALVAHSAWAAETPRADGSGLGTARALIECCLDRYESAASHRITFLQENYWALAETTYVTEGTLLLMRPSSLAIRYPDGGAVVSDGESLRVYVAATEQFFVAPVDSTDLLLDPARLLRAYEPDASTPVLQGGGSPRGTATVSMRPRDRRLEPARLDVTIDEDCDLTLIVAISSSGDRTRYRIIEADRDPRLPSDAFRLPRPAGAEMIRGLPEGQ